jgi:hypothetical protein
MFFEGGDHEEGRGDVGMRRKTGQTQQAKKAQPQPLPVVASACLADGYFNEFHAHPQAGLTVPVSSQRVCKEYTVDACGQAESVHS